MWSNVKLSVKKKIIHGDIMYRIVTIVNNTVLYIRMQLIE